MSPMQQLFLGQGGGGPKIFVDQVFSTYVYEGNYDGNHYSTWTQSIHNNVDLVNKGGLVWIKSREENSRNHALYDTERGVKKYISTNSTAAEVDETNETGSDEGLDMWRNTGGFRLGGGDDKVNKHGESYVSFTFRKAIGFMDICTWDGDGNSSRQISHGLDSVPGMILVKGLTSTSGWEVYHRSTGATKTIRFDQSNTPNTSSTRWNDTAPTSTHFTVSTSSNVNASGESYVAYVFAHDSQVYGQNGDQSIIKCGTYTTDSNEDATINLGWEPQWVLAKRIDSNSAADWMIVDSMRGLPNAHDVKANATGGTCKVLEANTSDSEINTSRIGITSTGFYADQFGSNREFIYMAIRRDDAHVSELPSDPKDVFHIALGNSSSTIPAFTSTNNYYLRNFPVDFALMAQPAVNNQNKWAAARLMGAHLLRTNANNTEDTDTNTVWDSNKGWHKGTYADTDWQSWMWKRSAGFTTLAYEGDGVEGRQLDHDLNNIPQMIWLKQRDNGENWMCYHFGLNGGSNPEDYWIILNNTSIQGSGSQWNNTAPTSTYFKVGNQGGINGNGDAMLAVLFSSVDGISKCGYYNGSENTITVTTGFQPRFLIVKRITGATNANWWVFDTQRGWGTTSANGLKLNENENHGNMGNISTITSTGFTLTSNNQWNGDGEKYIYYCHA